MPCYVSREQMKDYVEDRLLPTEAAALARHLVSCDVCRELSGIVEREIMAARPRGGAPRARPWWLTPLMLAMLAALSFLGLSRWFGSR